MSPTPVICVDGPSGSGKGTLSRALARQLGWHFLDSGALYRLVAVLAGQLGSQERQPDSLERLLQGARSMQAEFRADDRDQETITLNGQIVTDEVRRETTGNAASVYARLPQIRAALLERQRAFRRPPGLVADGRDMGTVVFPDAELKLFVTASARERAQRRALQLKQMGQDASIDRIFSEIEARDRRDSTRDHSPLLAADDAVQIDTSDLSPAEVLQQALRLVRMRGLAQLAD